MKDVFEKTLGNDRWKVTIKRVGGSILIEPIKNCGSCLTYNIYVNPPNFIESLLGITFQQKFIRVKQKAQKRCDKLNAKEDIAREVAESILQLEAD